MLTCLRDDVLACTWGPDFGQILRKQESTPQIKESSPNEFGHLLCYAVPPRKKSSIPLLHRTEQTPTWAADSQAE
jgi:hypothetical protein